MESVAIKRSPWKKSLLHELLVHIDISEEMIESSLSSME